MITIVNVGPHDGNLLGERNYEVRINSELVATFRHKRSEGLGRCLLEASKAVERKHWLEAGKSFRNPAEARSGPPPAPPFYVELTGVIEHECRAALTTHPGKPPKKPKPTPQQILRAKLEKQWSREEAKEEAAREREAARRAARERKARTAEAKTEEAKQRKALAEKEKAEKRARRDEDELLANALRNRLKPGKPPAKPKVARDASMRRVIRYDKVKVLKDGQVFHGSEGRGG